MGSIEKRITDILETFKSPVSVNNDSNPADEEFDRPSNFPEKVDVENVESVFKNLISNPDLGDDYEYLRNVFRHMMGRGLITLEGAINIAKETENPRSIEVVSTLMNTISEMGNKMMKLHEKIQGPEGDVPGKGSSAQTNNYYILDKGKDAKEILNGLLGSALEGECKDITPDK